MATKILRNTPERWPVAGIEGLMLAIAWRAARDGSEDAPALARMLLEVRGEWSIDRVTRGGNFAGAHVVA